MTAEQVTLRLRELGRGDHARFFGGVPAHAAAGGLAFSGVHQAMLRALYADGGPEAVEGYLADAGARSAAWDAWRRVDAPPVAAEELRELLAGAEIAILDDAGWGAYRAVDAVVCRGERVPVLVDDGAASVGARRRFAFARGSGEELFLQRLPVRTLHATLVAPAASAEFLGRSGGAARAELASVAGDAEQALLRAFVLHEQGHRLEDDRSSVIATLRDLGEDPARHAVIDAPSPERLRAWPRIEAGAGDLRDVTFVLGDLLANTVAWEAGLDADALAALRAVNRLTVPEGAPRRVPRGNAAFVSFARDDDAAGLSRLVASLLRDCAADPRSAAARLGELEAETTRAVHAGDRRTATPR